jgi:hypothetical protein
LFLVDKLSQAKSNPALMELLLYDDENSFRRSQQLTLLALTLNP